MKIENKKTASLIRLGFLVLPVLYALLISVLYFFEGLPKKPYLIGLLISFVIVVYILSTLKLYYIIFSIEAEKLTLRYISFGAFGGKKRSIQFPQKDFVRYEIKRSFYGYKKEIVLFRRTQKGTARYPVVSISSLSEPQIEEIEKMLKKLMHLNRVKR